MAETLKDRLRGVLSELSATDLHAVVAFAEFLRERRKLRDADRERKLSDDERACIIAALDRVAALSMEKGPAVSNRDHDKYLYGGS